MKDFEVTVRIRNNHLKERREALGMNQRQLAAAAGIPHQTYSGIECMRNSPYNKQGRWRKIAMDLAAFYDVEPIDLFPPAVCSVKKAVVTRKLDSSDIGLLLSTHQERLLEGPDGAYDRAELRDQIDESLLMLTPREEEVLRRRFGLSDGEEQSLEKIAQSFDLCRDRIRQIQVTTLRKLQNPHRHGMLLSDYGEEDPNDTD